MSYMKNYMMDIEEFCDGYFFGGDIERTDAVNGWESEDVIEEVAEDAKKFFGSSMAKDYAIVYLTKTLGEI